MFAVVNHMVVYNNQARTGSCVRFWPSVSVVVVVVVVDVVVVVHVNLLHACMCVHARRFRRRNIGDERAHINERLMQFDGSIFASAPAHAGRTSELDAMRFSIFHCSANPTTSSIFAQVAHV